MNSEENTLGWLVRSPDEAAEESFIRDRQTMELISDRGWSVVAVKLDNSPCRGKHEHASAHEGVRVARLSGDGPSAGRERCFASAWNDAQEHHLLGHLLGDGNEAAVVSQRDAQVAATVIQWLGTNVGQGFLRSAQESIENDKTKPN